MTSEPDPLTPLDDHARASDEGWALDVALWRAMDVQLRRRSDDLFTRWAAGARTALVFDDAHGDAVPSPRLVEAMLAAVGPQGDSTSLVEQGLRFGRAASDAGLALHYVVKAVELLSAELLGTIEDVLRGGLEHSMTPVQGIRFAGMVHRSMELLILAVVRGHTHADTESVRESLRHLRHDLRNPLGTIKSVLTLMDDETVPIESRANPTFRAMASRNAHSLEQIIGSRLGDAAIPTIAATEREVSVRAIVSAVLHDVRPEAEWREVSVTLGDADLRVRLDAPALELLLRAVVLAILVESPRGERISVELVRECPDRISLCMRRASGCTPIADRASATALTSLARQTGAALTVGDDLRISTLLRGVSGDGERVERERRVRTPCDDESATGQSRQDVGGTGQSEHGEAGLL